MSKTSMRGRLAAALIVVAALGLSSCTPTGPDNNTTGPDPDPTTSSPDPHASALDTEAPSESPSPTITQPAQHVSDVAKLPDGTKLSKDQTAALKASGPQKDGTYAYQLDNGTGVKINVHKPLPPAVKKDLNKKATAVSGVKDLSLDGEMASGTALVDLANEASQNTQKNNLIYIVQVISGTRSIGGTGIQRVWDATDTHGGGTLSFTKDGAIAYAKQTWPDAELIIADGN